MQPQVQYPDAAQRIMTLMKQTFGENQEIFKAYYLGVPNDLLILPEAAYPALIVQKAAGSYRVGPTMADDITEHVYVHILVNVKTGFGAPSDDYTVMRQLQTLVEGRDPTTGYLLSNTVIYALRTNLTLNSTTATGIVTINNDIQVSYDASHLPNLPNSREAVIDITVTERQVVLNRR